MSHTYLLPTGVETRINPIGIRDRKLTFSYQKANVHIIQNIWSNPDNDNMMKGSTITTESGVEYWFTFNNCETNHITIPANKTREIALKRSKANLKVRMAEEEEVLNRKIERIDIEFNQYDLMSKNEALVKKIKKYDLNFLSRKRTMGRMVIKVV